MTACCPSSRADQVGGRSEGRFWIAGGAKLFNREVSDVDVVALAQQARNRIRAAKHLERIEPEPLRFILHQYFGDSQHLRKSVQRQQGRGLIAFDRLMKGPRLLCL